LDKSREALANFLNVPTEEVVIVPNATTGVNTVLRNILFVPGDVIVYFSTIYGACEKTIEHLCEMTPLEKRKIPVTYPEEDEELIKKFLDTVRDEKAQGKTVKMAIFDIVSSQPAVRMPFERLTEACRNEGVMSLIDGAHGIGHLHIDLGVLKPDFFVSNCHK
jgi:selenocysteine lyase/cysteine desulfurase